MHTAAIYLILHLQLLYYGLGVFSQSYWSSNYSSMYKDFSKLKTFKTIFLVDALIIFLVVLGRYCTSTKFTTFQRYQEKKNYREPSFGAIFRSSKMSGR